MLLDQFGQPIAAPAARDPQTARLATRHREVAAHHTRGLTPVKLAGLLADAEQGNLVAQHELFIDMEERDAHLLSEMSKRKRALLTLEWDIVPPRNASAAETAAAGYAKELLQDMADLEDVVFDLMDAAGHGFSALELTWGMAGKEWLVEQLAHRPQSWFQLDRATHSQLSLRDDTPEGQPLQPFGWLLHVHRAKSGYLARSGLFRTLAWPFLFKHYSVRDIAEFLEIYGLPIRVGKYPVSANDQEKSTLLRAVVGIGHDAAGIIPAEMEIDFIEATKANHEPFLAFVEWCEKSMSKAILGGTLTSQADGKTSTHALGNVHNEVRHDLLVSDARQIGGTLTRDLIYPLLVLNGKLAGGSLRRCPRFVFDVVEPADLKLLAESLPKLADAGAPIPVSYVHTRLKIPMPQGDEPVLGRSQPVNPPAQDAPPGNAATRLASLRAGDDIHDRLQAARFDQAQIEQAGDQFAAEFSSLLGPRVESLMALLEETGDLQLFRERLDDLLADHVNTALVASLTNGALNAGLLALFRGNRNETGG